MCGIVAIYSYRQSSPPVDRAELLRIRDRMTARGPDGCGEWYSADGKVGMGHRRLAIIDLSETGAQPMQSSDGNLVIVFNGEIYNYRALRSSLEKKGYRFRSASDTEVLLNLYAEKGADMLNDLRGMYAFAIWDERDKSLFLARDPFGIKPLYYSDNGNTFRVASQVKALIAGGAIDTSPEPAGHVGFFLWGHVPEPFTFFKSISSLPAGTYMQIRGGQRRTKTFFSIRDELAEASLTPLELPREKIRERLRDALLDSVSHHLVADVPVGVFLSSGLDSTTLTALATEAGAAQLHSATLGFREYKGTEADETILAAEVARIYGTTHSTIWTEKADFQDELTNILDAMDRPTIDGVNSYFVSRAAVKAGLKVALSGLGGDELFGSYESFRQIPQMVRFLRPFSTIPGFGKAFRVVSAPFLKRFTSPKYASLFEYGGTYGGTYLLRRGMFMPWELPELLDGEMVKEGWQKLQTLIRLEEIVKNISSPYLKVSALEMCLYMRNQLLRDTDWASMAHSLEVRVPFLDMGLLHTLAPLMASGHPPNKQDMASSPVKALPEKVLNRGKTGFSVPVYEWLLQDREAKGERGLRGWAKKVYQSYTPAKQTSHYHAPILQDSLQSETVKKNAQKESFSILTLVTDGFGGHGGIAKFNRDLLTALCKISGCKEVVAIARLMPNQSEPKPAKLSYVTDGLNSKTKYMFTVLKQLTSNKSYDIIICCHINLLPIAYICKLICKAPLVLMLYGIDAWNPVNKYLINKIDGFISISEITTSRFLAWAKIDKNKGFILPCSVDINSYGSGPKNPALLKRYGLEGKTVLMTFGRLVSKERYKGFDEVLEILPDLAKEISNIAYLIVGDGDDRKRLEAKAELLGVKNRVVFAGKISEAEKADHYRLADVYVMPSRGEGFGIVYLEAMACGIPVIGSKVDGSREALRNGELGILVDPSNCSELKQAILTAILNKERVVPAGLCYFSFESFTGYCNNIMKQLLKA
ncbi:MAG: asparagine synthase (glutamine-hydrolyzing) [Candidatus Schekmanbacteria bacterium]|nr:asparagine synthase (glutamine-hydrolyzing) [Candidatus Schekmanbacteria bacterium]